MITAASRGRGRAVLLAGLFAFTTFAVDAAPVSLPGPLDGALGPEPAQAGYCASNAAFSGRLTGSSASTTALSRVTSPTVYSYISSVQSAWSCTLYYRYSGITWNTSASLGTFQWGNLINSDSVACNFVVGSTDYIKGNSTSDCPDTDAEYALSAALSAEGVYQRDLAHNGLGDFSFVQTDCASYYGANPTKTGQSFSTGDTGNRPSSSNCDPIDLDDTNTTQTITYDNTDPTAVITKPAAGGPYFRDYTTYEPEFNPSDAVAGFGGTYVWSLQRQIAPISAPGSCSATYTNSGAAVTGTVQGLQEAATQALTNGKCYRWKLTATDQNGNGPVTATSGVMLIDQNGSTVNFSAPDEAAAITVNTASYPVTYVGTDSYSDVDTRSLQRQRGTAGACSGFSDDGSAVSTYPAPAQTLTSGHCYRWVATVDDNAGNSTQVTSGTVYYNGASPSADFSTPDEGTTVLQTGTSYSVAWSESAGAGSITARSLQRQKGAIVTPSSCVGVSWSNDGSADTGTSPRNPGAVLAGGFCYRWIQTLTNSGGQQGAKTSGSVLVDTTAPTAAIADPSGGQTLGGDYVVRGTATDAHSFLDYTLEFGAGASPGSWTTIATSSAQAQATSDFGTWSTSGLAGTYTLRLTVNESAGNSAAVVTSTVTVANTGRGEEAYLTRIPFDLGGGLNLDVGVHNGEARLTRDLFSIPSFGPSQSLSLAYSSVDSATTGRFGAGWISNLTQHITFTGSDLAVWHRPDGGLVPFGKVGADWVAAAGFHDELTIDGGASEATITRPDQSAVVFESTGGNAGRIKRIEDRFGNALTFAWSTSSATVTDASSRVTDLTIDSGTGRIDAVEDSAGRLWEFDYTGTDLTGITDPEGALTELAYDGSHRLTSVTRERDRLVGADEEIVWTIAYTGGKATSVTDPESSDPNTFTYSAGSTEVDLLQDDTPTYATWTYDFDAAGRVTDLTDPYGHVTTSEYDAESNLIEQTVPTGDGSTSATTIWTYDASGNVLTEIRPIDDTTTVTTVNTYNATNDLLTRSEADGESEQLVTVYVYDGSGHLNSVNVNCTSSGTTPPSPASGCTGAGTQDAATNLITSFAYDANDQLEYELDPLGRITKHDYDAHGNRISTIQNCTTSGTTPPGTFSTCTGGGTADAQTNVETTTTYTSAGLPDEVTDPVGNVSEYTYDALGRQLTEILPGDASIPALTRTTVYDELDNILSESEAWDPLGPATTVTETTTHIYDLMNRETEREDPAGTLITTTYDAIGNAIESDEGGVVTARLFDLLGRVTDETVGGGEEATHQYDVEGNEIRGTSPEGVIVERTVNVAGWVTEEVTDPSSLALTTTTTYDLLGREETAESPEGVTTTTTYDRTGRATEVDVDGQVTTTVFDRAGNAVAVKAPDGAVAATLVDPLDRTVTSIANCTNSGTTQPAAGVACTGGGTHDELTNLESLTFYDAAGAIVATTDPRGISARTIVNSRGMAQETIANCTDSGATPTGDPPDCVGAGTANAVTNVSTTITYDGRGAALGTTIAVGTGAEATTETAYDAGGRVIAIKDPRGTITRSFYDAEGRLEETIVNCTTSGTTIPSDWAGCTGAGTANATYNLSTTFAYDDAGNQTSVIAPNGRETRTVYDADGRVFQRVEHYVNGTPSATDDLTTTYFYDEAGRQSGSLAPTADGLTVVATRIEYDADGRVTREIRGCTDSGTTVPENAGSCTGAGTKDAETNVITEYTYDARGNRITVLAPDPSETSATPGSPAFVETQYAYDAADRLCRVVENATGSTDLQALADPCATATQTGGTTTTNLSTRYTYDEAGNLASMIDARGETTSYEYDENGRMTALVDQLGDTLAWVYDAAGNRITQYDRETPLTPAVEWTYDGAGRMLTRTAATGIGSDSTAPTAPTALDATGHSDRIELVWAAASDAEGVTSYTIARGGSTIGRVSGTTLAYTDRTVAATTSYTYTVSAVDAAGNTSSASASDSATSGTPVTVHAADAFSRTTSGWGTADTGGSWTNQNTTDITTTGSVGRHSIPSETTRYTRLDGLNVTDQEGLLKLKVSSLTGSGSVAYARIETRADSTYANYYRFQVGFTASGGITMTLRKIVSGSTTTLRTDSNVVTSFTTSDSVWLRWKVTNSGSDVALTYKLWKDGGSEPGSFATTYTDTAPGSPFTGGGRLRFTGQALSGFSGSYPYLIDYDDLSLMAPGGGTDTTAPTVPGSLTARAAGHDRVELTWTASTDAVGVAGYKIYRDSTYLTTVGSTTWTDTGRSSSTVYDYTVSAIDAAANESSQTGVQSATTTAAGQTTYTYDDNGNRLTASAGPLTITTTYDRLNRVLTVDDEDAGTTTDTTTTYSFTSPAWTDPTGAYAATLDVFERPTALNDPVNGSDFTWSYRADGQVAMASAPNGNWTENTYDDLGRLVGKDTDTASGGGGTDRAVYAWTHNRAGQILSEASTVTGDPDNGTIDYAYDALGRLTGSTVSATTTAYGWEEAANRTSVQIGAGTPSTTTYDAANRPTSGASPSATYSHDDDGRLTARPGQTLEWDDLGRLITVSDPGGPTVLARYRYDPLDRLRQIEHPGTDRIRLRYTGQTTEVAQWLDDTTGTVTRSMANGWAGSGQLMDWTGAGSDLRYIGTNGHHDVTWLGSNTGTVSQALRYDPWGVPRDTVPTGYSPFRFQGDWHDDATDLGWIVTRWYTPSLGRFISEDSLLGEPVNPDSRHLYAYGEGEPIGRWDPDGRFWYLVKSGDTGPKLAKRFYPNSSTLAGIANIVNSNPGGDITPVSFATTALKTGQCIWIGMRNLPHECELWRKDAKQTAQLYRRYDAIMTYMRREMLTNAANPGKSMTCFAPTHGACSLTAKLGAFYLLETDDAPWDHKGKLKSRWGGNAAFHTPVRRDYAPERLFYDVWSNIHYGFVGRAWGFSGPDLLWIQDKLAKNRSARDEVSVALGIELWNRHGAGLTRYQFEVAIARTMWRWRKTQANTVIRLLRP